MRKPLVITGIADASLFTYYSINFKPKMSLVTMAKLLVVGVVIFLLLLVAIILILVRRFRRK
jgi:hypothetical protein